MKKLYAFSVALLLLVGFSVPVQAADCPCGNSCLCATGTCPDGCAGAFKAQAATVLVERPMGNGHTACGSGVCIGSEDGYSLVLTNSHVVSSSFKVDVVWRKADKPDHPYQTRGEVIGRSGDAGIYPDLALVLLDQTLSSVELADEVPDISTKVMSFGYGPKTATYDPVHRRGVVISDRFADPWLTSNLLQVEGDSGGGVFNTKGEVVGWNSRSGGNYTHALGANVATIRVFASTTIAQKRPHLFQKLRSKLAKLKVRLFPRLAAKMGVKAESNPVPAAPKNPDKAAPAPKPVPAKKAEPKKVEAPKKVAGPLSYPAGHAQALKDNKPLVVFVACPNVRPVPGAVVAQGSMMLPLPRDTGIVVLKPNGKGQMVVTQCLKGCASDAVLAAEVAKASK